MDKKSTIGKMMLGNRGTFEQVKLSEEYKKASEEMFAVVDTFLEKLNEEQKELFDIAYESIMNKCDEHAFDNFEEGFKFGLLLGIEAAKD